MPCTNAMTNTKGILSKLYSINVTTGLSVLGSLRNANWFIANINAEMSTAIPNQLISLGRSKIMMPRNPKIAASQCAAVTLSFKNRNPINTIINGAE